MKNRHVMIIAGEASGDMRAAGLARALKRLDSSLRLSGIGGEHMRRAGVECFADITELAVIGIAEVVKNFNRIKKVFRQTLAQIDASRPDAVVLVDYPGFNLRLAGEIKKRGLKVIYYISPQVWAWRENRILKIKKLVDRMIVLFPFEKQLYEKYGMKADYAGHPLAEEIIVNHDQTEVLKALGLSASKTTIGLMPGSRLKEVERHLPCMLEAAKLLYSRNRERQFILLKASSIPLKLIESIVSSCRMDSAMTLPDVPLKHAPEAMLGPFEELEHFPLKIYDGNPYDGINAADAVMVASGTATLECALLKKPMVIIYKTSWLTYAVAKTVIKIPYIGLVNVVAGKKIVEELLQNDATAKRLSDAMESVLYNHRIIDELAAVKDSLGEPGASQRAAKVILETAYPI
ncbi:MAG: lipid-A-disaccharide synthase [Candidatus Omnitrophica bacterium]|nr:lipid-A-disaccharide synthase [Candidatus Omnitrophota bacterium]MDE2214245.1 lipid-A-disaccharide synthase [Candidatus Omnitrophota bacterium]